MRALALAIAVAEPGGPGIEVIWDAPASCPDAATARAEILARVADRPAARELEATARVRALDDGAWQVEVLLRSDEGTATRTLRAASCREALTATAVVVAIAVDPSLEPPPAADATTVVPPPPASEPSPGSPTASEPSPTVVEPSRAASREGELPSGDGAEDAASPAIREPARREVGMSASVRGGLDFGALPSPAGHVAAAVGLFGRRFEIQAGALHRIRTDSSVEALPRAAGGRFRLTVAQLRAGPRLRWGAFELPLAAGLELGAIWARGIGDVEPITVRRSWTAAIVSAGVGWTPRTRLPSTSFALQLGLDGVIPFLRPTFVLGDEVEVLTVGSFAVRAWLGVAVRFSL